MSNIYDVIIIGAGPAGLAAGIYAVERRLNTLLLEGNIPGGQLMTLYQDKDIYDYPSYSDIKAKELGQKLFTHAQAAGVALRTGMEVYEFKAESDQFRVSTKNAGFNSHSVILATGAGSFAPRKLGIPGEKEFQNLGIYYQNLPEKVLGKRIIIIGGGDTALETAVSATEKGASVMIVHRKGSFRALEKTVEKAHSLSIPMYLSAEIVAISGTDHVENIEIIKNSGTHTLLSVDYVCVSIGMELDSSLITKLELVIEKQAVKLDANMQTSSKGVFACGDLVIQTGKYKRISVAVGSAAAAVNGCYQYLKNPYWKS